MDLDISNHNPTGCRAEFFMQRAFSVGRRYAHNCVGCGQKLVIPLPKTIKEAAGNTQSIRGAADRKLDELYTRLSPTQLSALSLPDADFSATNEVNKPTLIAQLNKKQIQLAKKSKVCKPCVMAREGSTNPVVVSNHPVKEKLGRKFHVVDALDFPLGLPSDLNLLPVNDIIVVNRCDLIVSHASQLPKFKRYCMETVFKNANISSDRVILTSAARQWHLSKLSELLVTKPKRNYFCGPTNSGKTRLVHELSGIPQSGSTGGPTTWPLPFSTQQPTEYRSSNEYRGKALIDCPSSEHGFSLLSKLVPSVLRKVSAGIRMTQRDPKYTLPLVKSKTGQCVNIGGIVALEFPSILETSDSRKSMSTQIPIHTFVGIGGINHTEYARATSNIEKLQQINDTMRECNLKMLMHNEQGLKLIKVAEFTPQSANSLTKQSIIVQNLGYLQPYVFGSLPSNYRAAIWAPACVKVDLRPEILSYFVNK